MPPSKSASIIQEQVVSKSTEGVSSSPKASKNTGKSRDGVEPGKTASEDANTAPSPSGTRRSARSAGASKEHIASPLAEAHSTASADMDTGASKGTAASTSPAPRRSSRMGLTIASPAGSDAAMKEDTSTGPVKQQTSTAAPSQMVPAVSVPFATPPGTVHGAAPSVPVKRGRGRPPTKHLKLAQATAIGRDGEGVSPSVLTPVTISAAALTPTGAGTPSAAAAGGHTPSTRGGMGGRGRGRGRGGAVSNPFQRMTLPELLHKRREILLKLRNLDLKQIVADTPDMSQAKSSFDDECRLAIITSNFYGSNPLHTDELVRNPPHYAPPLLLGDLSLVSAPTDAASQKSRLPSVPVSATIVADPLALTSTHMTAGPGTGKQEGHREFLLKELEWMAEDFADESKRKKRFADRISAAVLRYKEIQDRRPIEEAVADELRRRKRASRISTHVMKFWGKIDKLVSYKHKSRLDAMKRALMDKHLNFLVSQTERYTSYLAVNVRGEADNENEDTTQSAMQIDAGPSETTGKSAKAIEVGLSTPTPAAATPVGSKRSRALGRDEISISSTGASTATSNAAVADTSAPTVSPAVTEASIAAGNGKKKRKIRGTLELLDSDTHPDLSVVPTAASSLSQPEESLSGVDSEAESEDSGASSDSFEYDSEAEDAQDDESTLEQEERLRQRRLARKQREELRKQGLQVDEEGDEDEEEVEEDIEEEEEDESKELSALEREAEMDIEELRRLYGLAEGESSDEEMVEVEDASVTVGGFDVASAVPVPSETMVVDPSSTTVATTTTSTALVSDEPLDTDGFVTPTTPATSADEGDSEETDAPVSSSATKRGRGGARARGRGRGRGARTGSTASRRGKSAASESGGSADATKKGTEKDKTATASTSSTELAAKHVVPVPFLLRNGHMLRQYQRDGLDWLVTMHDRRLNGILADEMGLGKTIQTISLLAHLASEKSIWGPHLIVVPTSTLLNWEAELRRWCPALKVLTYYGTVRDRKMKRVGWTKQNAFHVCITSYQTILSDAPIFRRKQWYYMILDEAHYIKNYASSRWQTLLTFSTQRRLLLTGTPLQNSLLELWSLMHFLMPNLFTSQAEFKTWFANPLTSHVEGVSVVDKSLVMRLHTVLRPFVMRRLKSEVATQMPKKYEHVIMCKLSTRQRLLYEDFMSRSSTRASLASGSYLSMMNVLMQLRKVCNHPDLFEARPIVSPFQCVPIHFHFPASLLDSRVLYHEQGFSTVTNFLRSGVLSKSLAVTAEKQTSQLPRLSIDDVVASMFANDGDQSVLFEYIDQQLFAGYEGAVLEASWEEEEEENSATTQAHAQTQVAYASQDPLQVPVRPDVPETMNYRHVAPKRKYTSVMQMVEACSPGSVDIRVQEGKALLQRGLLPWKLGSILSPFIQIEGVEKLLAKQRLYKAQLTTPSLALTSTNDKKAADENAMAPEELSYSIVVNKRPMPVPYRTELKSSYGLPLTSFASHTITVRDPPAEMRMPSGIAYRNSDARYLSIEETSMSDYLAYADNTWTPSPVAGQPRGLLTPRGTTPTVSPAESPKKADGKQKKASAFGAKDTHVDAEVEHVGKESSSQVALTLEEKYDRCSADISLLQDRWANDYSIAFAAGITSLPCVTFGMGLADLELRAPPTLAAMGSASKTSTSAPAVAAAAHSSGLKPTTVSFASTTLKYTPMTFTRMQELANSPDFYASPMQVHRMVTVHEASEGLPDYLVTQVQQLLAQIGHKDIQRRAAQPMDVDTTPTTTAAAAVPNLNDMFTPQALLKFFALFDPAPVSESLAKQPTKPVPAATAIAPVASRGRGRPPLRAQQAVQPTVAPEPMLHPLQLPTNGAPPHTQQTPHVHHQGHPYGYHTNATSVTTSITTTTSNDKQITRDSITTAELVQAPLSRFSHSLVLLHAALFLRQRLGLYVRAERQKRSASLTLGDLASGNPQDAWNGVTYGHGLRRLVSLRWCDSWMLHSVEWAPCMEEVDALLYDTGPVARVYEEQQEFDEAVEAAANRFETTGVRRSPDAYFTARPTYNGPQGLVRGGMVAPYGMVPPSEILTVSQLGAAPGTLYLTKRWTAEAAAADAQELASSRDRFRAFVTEILRSTDHSYEIASMVRKKVEQHLKKRSKSQANLLESFDIDYDAIYEELDAIYGIDAILGVPPLKQLKQKRSRSKTSAKVPNAGEKRSLADLSDVATTKHSSLDTLEGAAYNSELPMALRKFGVSRRGTANLASAYYHVQNPSIGTWAVTSSALRGMVRSAEERYQEMLPALSRFTFLIPKVSSPPPLLISPALVNKPKHVQNLEVVATKLLKKAATPYHDSAIRMQLSFPDRRLVQFDCGKLQALETLLRERKAGGHKVLIFTQMTRMLDILETFLNLHDHSYLRLDGSTKVEERQALMDRFNRDPKIFAFILSTRSGGLGINLVGADTVIFYDSDWNPAMDAQAQDRAHRIGQTREVNIYRLVSESTIEENILLKARQKRDLATMSLEEGNFSMEFFQGDGIRKLIENTHGFTETLSREVSASAGDKKLSEDEIAAAMAAAEDDEDVSAGKSAAVEMQREVAEFDDSAQAPAPTADMDEMDDDLSDMDSVPTGGPDAKKGKKGGVGAKGGKKRARPRAAEGGADTEEGSDDNASDSEDITEAKGEKESGQDKVGVVATEVQASEADTDDSDDSDSDSESESESELEELSLDASKAKAAAKKAKGAVASKKDAAKKDKKKKKKQSLKKNAVLTTLNTRKSMLDVDLDKLQREILAAEEDIDTTDLQGADGSTLTEEQRKAAAATDKLATTGKSSATAVFDAVFASSGPNASKSVTFVRDRVGVAMSKFAAVTNALGGAEKYALQYREHICPHPHVAPEVIASLEAELAEQELEWEIEQMEILVKEEDALAQSTVEELIFGDSLVESAAPTETATGPLTMQQINTARGEHIYTSRLRKLQWDMRYREATGAAWQERIDERYGERYYHNIFTGQNVWEKPLVLREADARRMMRVHGFSAIHRLPVVAVTLMQMFTPVERNTVLNRVCKSWKVATSHPHLYKFVHQPLHTNVLRTVNTGMAAFQAAFGSKDQKKSENDDAKTAEQSKSGGDKTDKASASTSISEEVRKPNLVKTRYECLREAVEDSLPGDTIVVGFGSHYVPGSLEINHCLRVISQGVKGFEYTSVVSPLKEWIAGPLGDWYPSLLQMPPSQARSIGLSSGNLYDADFAVGASSEDDPSVADAAIVRLEGPLLWNAHYSRSKTSAIGNGLSGVGGDISAMGGTGGVGSGSPTLTDIAPMHYSHQGRGRPRKVAYEDHTKPPEVSAFDQPYQLPGGSEIVPIQDVPSSLLFTALYTAGHDVGHAFPHKDKKGEEAAKLPAQPPDLAPSVYPSDSLSDLPPVAVSLPRGGGLLRGITLRNVKSAESHCIVVRGPGAVLCVRMHDALGKRGAEKETVLAEGKKSAKSSGSEKKANPSAEAAAVLSPSSTTDILPGSASTSNAALHTTWRVKYTFPPSVIIQQCDIGNRGGRGSAVSLELGSVTHLIGCRISSGTGSGLYVQDGSVATVVRSTVQECGGAGVSVSGGSLALYDTIVRGSLGPAIRITEPVLHLPYCVGVRENSSVAKENETGLVVKPKLRFKAVTNPMVVKQRIIEHLLDTTIEANQQLLDRYKTMKEHGLLGTAPMNYSSDVAVKQEGHIKQEEGVEEKPVDAGTKLSESVFPSSSTNKSLGNKSLTLESIPSIVAAFYSTLTGNSAGSWDVSQMSLRRLRLLRSLQTALQKTPSDLALITSLRDELSALQTKVTIFSYRCKTDTGVEETTGVPDTKSPSDGTEEADPLALVSASDSSDGAKTDSETDKASHKTSRIAFIVQDSLAFVPNVRETHLAAAAASSTPSTPTASPSASSSSTPVSSQRLPTFAEVEADALLPLSVTPGALLALSDARLAHLNTRRRVYVHLCPDGTQLYLATTGLRRLPPEVLYGGPGFLQFRDVADVPRSVLLGNQDTFFSKDSLALAQEPETPAEPPATVPAEKTPKKARMASGSSKKKVDKQTDVVASQDSTSTENASTESGKYSGHAYLLRCFEALYRSLRYDTTDRGFEDAASVPTTAVKSGDALTTPQVSKRKGRTSEAKSAEKEKLSSAEASKDGAHDTHTPRESVSIEKFCLSANHLASIPKETTPVRPLLSQFVIFHGSTVGSLSKIQSVVAKHSTAQVSTLNAYTSSIVDQLRKHYVPPTPPALPPRAGLGGAGVDGSVAGAFAEGVGAGAAAMAMRPDFKAIPRGRGRPPASAYGPDGKLIRPVGRPPLAGHKPTGVGGAGAIGISAHAGGVHGGMGLAAVSAGGIGGLPSARPVGRPPGSRGPGRPSNAARMAMQAARPPSPPPPPPPQPALSTTASGRVRRTLGPSTYIEPTEDEFLNVESASKGDASKQPLVPGAKRKGRPPKNPNLYNQQAPVPDVVRPMGTPTTGGVGGMGVGHGQMYGAYPYGGAGGAAAVPRGYPHGAVGGPAVAASAVGAAKGAMHPAPMAATPNQAAVGGMGQANVAANMQAQYANLGLQNLLGALGANRNAAPAQQAALNLFSAFPQAQLLQNLNIPGIQNNLLTALATRQLLTNVLLNNISAGQAPHVAQAATQPAAAHSQPAASPTALQGTTNPEAPTPAQTNWNVNPAAQTAQLQQMLLLQQLLQNNLRK